MKKSSKEDLENYIKEHSIYDHNTLDFFRSGWLEARRNYISISDAINVFKSTLDSSTELLVRSDSLCRELEDKFKIALGNLYLEKNKK